jgi:hypothetical protein
MAVIASGGNAILKSILFFEKNIEKVLITFILTNFRYVVYN